jgi:effector-binding domain-containing protein
MTQPAPEIVTLPERHYLAIAASVTMATFPAVVPPLNGEVFRWLAARGIAPAGPPLLRYNVIDMAGILEVEAGSQVATGTVGDDHVRTRVLPAGRYVTLRHTGAPETLIDANAALQDWAASQGLKWDKSPSPEGDRWGCRVESYLTDPITEPDMNNWVTEIAYRLAG